MQACTECDTHRGESMIHLEYINRAQSVQTVPVVCMHCEQPTCAEVCPADAIKRTGDGVVQSALQAALHRVRQLRAGVPVRRARGVRGSADHDEVRHVLRPHERRQEADVRDRLPEPGAVLRHREQIEQLRPMSEPVNRFQFGSQTISTRVS